MPPPAMRIGCIPIIVDGNATMAIPVAGYVLVIKSGCLTEHVPVKWVGPCIAAVIAWSGIVAISSPVRVRHRGSRWT